jgi:DNA-binding XRE family transcriptional regulator
VQVVPLGPTAELNTVINLTWLGFCVVHEPDCLNSLTRQIGIEVDKCSSSVEFAFRIAYIFQVPLEQFFQYTLPKLHRALILLSCPSSCKDTRLRKGSAFPEFRSSNIAFPVWTAETN